MASLLPFGLLQFLDSNGDPLAGGSVGYYDPAVPGLLKAIWADHAQTVPVTNPVTLDAAGRPFSGGSEVGIWGTGEYLMVVLDFNGALQWTAMTIEPLSDTGGTINGDLTVNGNIVAQNVGITGNLGVNGISTLQNVLIGTGTAQLTNLTVTATLGVVNTANLNVVNIADHFAADNPAATNTIGGTLNIVGPLGVGGNTAFTGATNSFVGSMGIGQALHVSGNAPGTGTGASYIPAGEQPSALWNQPIGISADWGISSVVGLYTGSDARFKTNIADITDREALDWVLSGRPRTFMFNGRPSAGFVAQEDLTAGRELAINVIPNPDPRFAETDGMAPAGHHLARDLGPDVAMLTKALQVALKRIEHLEDVLYRHMQNGSASS